MRFLYTFALRCYFFAICLAAPFNAKAKLWVKGRTNSKAPLLQFCQNHNRIYWFHCASLGEFEQGKPIMQLVKNKYPDVAILVTFFSPSGYEIKKNDSIADFVTYIPLDTPRLANQFISMVQPEKVIFVKYEFWFNFMKYLSQKSIPFYYVAANFRPSQYFFKPYGRWFARQLRLCSLFFVQNKCSQQLLRSIGISQSLVTGDTRFDRVYTIAQQQVELDYIRLFKGNAKLLVAGSTWLPDEMLLLSLFNRIHQDYKIVIAPHVIDKEHINKIKQLFANYQTITFSELNSKNVETGEVFILDTIGVLNKVYRYGEVAYVGGAFETGLHNILEAAVYGIPLFFGTHYQKFNEAVDLVNLHGAFSVKNYQQMVAKIEQFQNDLNYYEETCNICKTFVNNNLGASTRIMEAIEKK